MRQANLSRSLPRVLRGMHVHERQCDLWIVVDGKPFIAIVDIRPIIKGEGPAQVETLTAGPGDAFFLPEGVAHGFYTPEETTLLYLVTNEYDGTTHGFRLERPRHRDPMAGCRAHRFRPGCRSPVARGSSKATRPRRSADRFEVVLERCTPVPEDHACLRRGPRRVQHAPRGRHGRASKIALGDDTRLRPGLHRSSTAFAQS